MRADIVHSSMNGLATLVGMAAKWTYGTPLVLSEHGIYLRERYISYLHDKAPHPVRVLVLSFFRSLAGAAYLITDALAPHSQYNRRWQLHNGADPARMWTMYNDVDPAEFPLATGEPEVPTISFMGRVDPLKDLHTLIRAFALVRAEIPAARLRIFGGTPAANKVYHASSEALIDELGLTGQATLEGRVGVGGVAEAVGDTGIVVAPRDVAAVAAACVRLLRDQDLRLRLGAAARARVLEKFTPQRSLEAYRDVYLRLVAPRPASAPPRLLRGQAQGLVRVPNRKVRPGVAAVPARVPRPRRQEEHGRPGTPHLPRHPPHPSACPPAPPYSGGEPALGPRRLVAEPR